MAKKIYNIMCRKIEPEARDAYRAHAEGYIEQHGGDDGESVGTGEIAHYAVTLDEAGVAAFREASNLVLIEEAPEDTIHGTPRSEEVEADAALHNGVDRDALAMHKMLDLDPGPHRPLLMVADTGATSNSYVASRMLKKWTWFSDDGMGRNSHGPWCLGAATPPESGKFVISAKVLGDNGSGSSANVVAALYRFARLCRDRKIVGVASLSLGSRTPSQAYKDAIDYCTSMGVCVLGSAGNDGRKDGLGYPGAYAASVGAHDRNWAAAGFSNRNPSGSLPDVYGLGVSVNGIGGVKTGTSMITPIVARAVWYAMSRGMKAQAVKGALRAHGGAARILDAGRLLPALPKSPAPKPEQPAPEPSKTLYRVHAGGKQRGAFSQMSGSLKTAGELLKDFKEIRITKG